VVHLPSGSVEAAISKGRTAMTDDLEQEDFDPEEYDDLEMLEILETIREDMEELGLRTLDEVIERIEELHRKLENQHKEL
jgi:hypothetical protein